MREVPGADPGEHQHGRDPVRALRLEDVLQRASEREEDRQGAMIMRRATIVLSGPDAGVVYEALRPETGREVPKARVAMRPGPGRLTLTIDADDTSALRAAVNSYLRWADVAARVRHEVKARRTFPRSSRTRSPSISSSRTSSRSSAAS